MTEIFAGIDVSKASLDMAIRPLSESLSVANNDEGIEKLIARLQKVEPALVVVEATGGLEMILVSSLAAADIVVVVINLRQVRDCVKALGKLAKTDKLDAAVLAHFAEAVRPEPRPLLDEQTRHLAVKLARRRQLISMLVQEKNRLSAARSRLIRKDIETHIKWLQQRIDSLDDELAELIRKSPLWREKDRLLA